MSARCVLATLAAALFTVTAAEGKDWYGCQTLEGEGTDWWDKEGFPLASPLDGCRRTEHASWNGRCIWMVTLEQPAADAASFELIDLNDDGWNRTPFTVSSGEPWEFEVVDTPEELYDPHWVLRTDSPEPWTLVFAKKDPRAVYLQGGDFKAEFKIEKYRQPTEAPFDFCDFSLCRGGERFDDKPASWSSRKAVVFWAFDPENPEAMVKVLDGRVINGHWWLDLAVTSDLYTTTIVHPVADSDHGWVFATGRAAAFGVTGEQ